MTTARMPNPTWNGAYGLFRFYLAATLAIPVTTKAESIAAFLGRDEEIVVFCTYHSSPRLAEVFAADAALQGFDLITPNEGEGRFALGDQDSGVRSLALRLLEGANARNMIMTLGERGVLAYRRSSTAPRSFFYLDSFANTLVDAVGAGDALLSAATLALKSSGSLVEAAIIGEAAAAAACEIDGNIPVERDDIKRRLADLLDPMAAGSN